MAGATYSVDTDDAELLVGNAAVFLEPPGTSEGQSEAKSVVVLDMRGGGNCKCWPTLFNNSQIVSMDFSN
jgi:hypothetical protein